MKRKGTHYGGRGRLAGARVFLAAALCCSAVLAAEVASGAGEKTPTWSFDFKQTPVSDALAQLRARTGIDIFANKVPADRVLNKSYVEQTIEQILRDLFKGVDYALILHEGQRGVDAITIWVLDQEGAVVPGYNPGYAPGMRQAPVVSSPARRGPTNVRLPGARINEDDDDEEEEEEPDDQADIEPSAPAQEEPVENQREVVEPEPVERELPQRAVDEGPEGQGNIEAGEE